MKYLFLLLVSFYLLLFIPSCKPKPDFSREIMQLDSAATELQRAQTHASENEALDSTGIKFLVESLEEVRSKLRSDTVDKNTGIMLEKINNMKSMLTELKKYREDQLRASVESLDRIKNLQHDLKENIIEENKAREYVVHETKALNRISSELDLIHDVYITTAGKLDSLRPGICSLLDSLSNP